MKAKDLAEVLLRHPDMDVSTKLHIRVTEEELKKMSYPYPYRNVEVELDLDDIGYSDGVICLGCNIDE